jgi:hypothetical protein
MSVSRLLTVQNSRIGRWVFSAGLILAVMAGTGAGVTQVWAEAPVITQAPILSDVITLEALASMGELYFSADDGSDGRSQWKWRPATSARLVYPTCLAIDPQNARVVYMGTNYNSLFKSMDGGITFARSSIGLGAGSQVAVTAIHLPKLYPGLLMAATAYWVGATERNLVPQGLFLSTNGGQSWFQFSDAVGTKATTSLDLDSAMVVTARLADDSIQRIPLDMALSDLMQYATAEAQSQVPVAMALLGIPGGETELNRRFWNGEDLPATVAALALLGTPSTIRTLVSALADPRETARRHSSMQALESLGERAVPALISALFDDNPLLRSKAAEMLGWIASVTAKPALEYTLADEDRTVRIAAAWALTQIR